MIGDFSFFFFTASSMHAFFVVWATDLLRDPLIYICFYPQVHFPDVEKVDWVNKVQYKQDKQNKHTAVWFYRLLCFKHYLCCSAHSRDNMTHAEDKA